MDSNPLFPTNLTPAQPDDADSAAVRLIREKVARAFSAEPNAVQELSESTAAKAPSKHQQFMQELSASGKSLAEIQTAWHHYYVTLPDIDKHAVWQEFYAANQNTPYQKLFQKQQQTASRKAVAPAPEPTAAATQPHVSGSGVYVADHTPVQPKQNYQGPNLQAAENLKEKVLHKVSAGGKLKVRHHVQSLLFGLATGVVVLVVLLFSFFNEYIIAPFIQPSRKVSATPIILSSTATLASSTPQVIIPKINVQIPLDFGVQTNDENAIENALQDGIVHYPSTVLPGQNGNTAFFGHSSNNIFNPGKYKFAFVLLHTLTTGDIFYITYNGKEYAYQVFAREVVDPGQVSVLTDTKGKAATATLITCDPPGTSLHRLVVWGEQISPDPAGNTAGTLAAAPSAPRQLASNGPTLWQRLVGTIEFWH